MRILLIEDEKGVVRFISKGLIEEGFTIDSCESAELALEQIKYCEYDLIILDVSLPKMNGFDFLALFRKSNKKTPVLILTAKDTISDKRLGFKNECDDYLTKPFHFEELLFRIRALLRRNSHSSSVLSVGKIRLQVEAFKVFIEDEYISLTKKEFALLRYFLANEDRVLSRTQILNHVWQQSHDIGSNVVDVTVRSLRKKIHREGIPQISTVYGVGYVLQNE
ncbi:response regulator transcription factor [Candidatus Uabimicrobium sp. HlEnr_7]|uniref:response regulator transcription factor n=1 Tax=Candidatus Uabimicrobium helgolandensis TaxID=3095367 RepID=UPI0035577DD6